MTTSLWLPQPEAAAIGEVAGHPVVLHHGDPEREYGALRSDAMLVDRSERLRLTFDGAGSANTLTGLITNDVLALEPGQGHYAAALTPKGKVISDVRVFAISEGKLLVDAPPRAAPGLMAMLQKYVNPRVARVSDVSAEIRDLGLFGVQSRRIVADLTGLPAPVLQAMPLYGHVTATIDDRSVIVARVPDLGLEGYELFADIGTVAELRDRAAAAGATPVGLSAFDIARIEAGRPEWGVDMDDATIAQEANLDELHAISYTKGCYTGQETVARVHFRGQVNRHLRGLRLTEPRPLSAGVQLADSNGKAVGDVRSSVLSPRLGNIAMAMVRREVESGATVRAGDAQPADAIVWTLPFPL